MDNGYTSSIASLYSSGEPKFNAESADLMDFIARVESRGDVCGWENLLLIPEDVNDQNNNNKSFSLTN